jgi:ATP-dependent RNA helicase DeaD
LVRNSSIFSFMEKFRALGLSEVTLAALAQKGYVEPSEIQAQAIPILLDGTRDVIGQAQTGTGKTAAFGLPILEKLVEGARHVQALIITPTRELAIQVSNEIDSFKGTRNLRILTVYGGAPIGDQLRQLGRGVDVVVGTPGRVIDMINRGALRCDKLSYFVLDEADEMLNMGFADDIEEIFRQTNEEKSVLLFSATMPERIASLAKSYMRDPQMVTVKKTTLTTDLIEQVYYEVYDRDKVEALCRILDKETDFYGIIFCNTKADVDSLTIHLNDRGYRTEALHGDIVQQQREKILHKFKKRQATVLIATDVAARGIDVSNLSHVVNYALPHDPESYVHRIGRTGRAGNKGVAITLLTPADGRKLAMIKRIAKAEIKRVPVPSIKEVLKSKRLKIQASIATQLAAMEGETDYADIAKTLLENNDPVALATALLQYTFQDALSPDNYREIKDVAQRPDRNNERTSGGDRFGNDRFGSDRGRSHDRTSSEDRNRGRGFDFEGGNVGKTVDLFLAMGRNDQANPKVVADFIENKTGVKSRNVTNIRVFEKHTTMSVPSPYAEKILDYFRTESRGKQPLIRKDRKF